MRGEEIQVLDHGFVRLDSSDADDLAVVNAARVSFGMRKETMDEPDVKLVGYLMRERHGTPFEHNFFRFHVKAPLFVFREWQRHRVGSFNEMSGRYKEFTDADFYVPAEFRTQTGKPGAYTFEKWKGNAKMAQAAMLRHCEDSMDLYRWSIDNGMAKEQARIVLPLALYSEMYWSVNARSLMNFLSLRNADQAQHEIREYAKIVEELFAGEMPVTYNAFLENGRITP